MSIFKKNKKQPVKKVGVKVVEIKGNNIDEIGEAIANEVKNHLKKSTDNGKIKIALNGDSVTVDFPATTGTGVAKSIHDCTSIMLNDIEEIVLNGTILTKMFNVDNRSLGDFIGEAMAKYGRAYDEMNEEDFDKAVVKATERNVRVLKALCPEELKDFVCNVVDTITKQGTEEKEEVKDE